MLISGLPAAVLCWEWPLCVDDAARINVDLWLWYAVDSGGFAESQNVPKFWQRELPRFISFNIAIVHAY